VETISSSWACSVSAEDRIAADHPLRAIRRMTDVALAGLSEHFDTLYAAGGRPSIAPEKLVRALLLQALYSVCSERQLMEQLDYNLLFRWFVGLNMDDAIWDVTVFTKNRERLLKEEVAERLLLAVVEQAHAHRLLSEEHFTVDGTLIQAWVNRRSFREKQDPPDKGTGARGRKLLRDTHESTTDPEARLYRKSSAGAVVPSYLGHVLTENRNGLVVAALATQSSTTAEREAALRRIDRSRQRGSLAGEITLGPTRAIRTSRSLSNCGAGRWCRTWPSTRPTPSGPAS
jgi:transposase